MIGVRIVRIETLHHPAHPHLLHVMLEAADGAQGLGETFGAAAAVEAYVHEIVAPRLLALPGGSPAELRAAAQAGLYGAPRAAGPASVETASASAVDIAAWDLAARRAGVSLTELLGSPARERVSLYNTCCDPDHEWGVGGEGPHADFTATLEDPAGLARALSDDGFGVMKTFPFAPERDVARDIQLVTAAVATGRIAVAVDLAGAFPAAEGREIALALDACGLAWIEDPLPAGDPRSLAELAGELVTPVCSGEALAGDEAFEQLAREGGVALVHCDVSWGGGVSGALEAATAAARHRLPVTFHDCTGPVAWATSLHLAAHLENAVHAECVRTFVRGPYPAIADGLPALEHGTAEPNGPGHGTALTADYREACSRRTSAR